MILRLRTAFQFSALSLAMLVMLFASPSAIAACAALANTTLGAGVAGQVQMSTAINTSTYNKLMYCNGSNWKDFGGSATTTPCTQNGAIVYNSPKLQYCNDGFYWDFDSTGNSNGSCAAPGSFAWNSTYLSYCGGTTNYVVQVTDTQPDPFSFTNQPAVEAEAAAASTVRFTGITPTNADIIFDTAACTAQSARVCADAACSTGISSRTSNGPLAVSNGSYLRVAFASGTIVNDTCNISVTVGSVSSTFTATTAADTIANRSTNFADSIAAPTSSLVESNIVKYSGFTGSITGSISDNALGGNPEFRVCKDATCSVVESTYSSADRPITNPSWIQLRVTTGGALSFARPTIAVGTGTPVTWYVTPTSCPGLVSPTPGQQLTCTCPSNFPTNFGSLNGVGNYRQTSSICRAAIHAGKIVRASGGSITVTGSTAGTPSGTCASYLGSTANGMTSNVSSSAYASMFFAPSADVCN